MRSALFPLVFVLAACGGEAFTIGHGPGGDAGEPLEASLAPDAPSANDAGDGPQSGGDGGDAVAGDSADLSSDAGDGGRACLSTLAGVGEGDFSITFTITTVFADPMAIASQRVGCADGSSFWDLELSSSGGVVFTANDGASSQPPVSLEAGNSVNDGKPHAVLITRRAGELHYERDGVTGSATIADPVAFDALPALVVGSDACPGVSPTVGMVSDLCLSSP